MGAQVTQLGQEGQQLLPSFNIKSPHYSVFKARYYIVTAMTVKCLTLTIKCFGYVSAKDNSKINVLDFHLFK